MPFFNLIISESVKAIRGGASISHLYDDIETIKQEYRCYGLNHMDVIAIRLYTTAIAFVVNEALRNYSLYDMPIPTTFLPYIYALLNGLAKLDRDREINEVHPMKTLFRLLYFYCFRLFVVSSLNLLKWLAIFLCWMMQEGVQFNQYSMLISQEPMLCIRHLHRPQSVI
jgi:hypothetical protein